MDYRKLTSYLLLCFCFTNARSQETSYRTADSLSYAYYLQGDWVKLASYGNTLIRSGIDFPLLRQRMGYGYFLQQNYSASLKEYEQALRSDSHNETALLYVYLCNTYLNRPAEAAFAAATLSDTVRSFNKVKTAGIREAGAETSIKTPALVSRGSGTYVRLFLKAQPFSAMLVDQSVIFFNQPVLRSTNQQFEYFGKAAYPLSQHFVALGAYHYLNSSYDLEVYNNHMGLAGLIYSQPAFDVQADVLLSTLNGRNVRQTDAGIKVYPTGNLNLYTFTRGSVVSQNSGSATIFSQLVGVKLSGKMWIEGFGTFGGLENYAEADGLYLYNSIDDTRYKAGTNLYILLNGATQLALNYTFESKSDFKQQIIYTQHSISGGISWKF